MPTHATIDLETLSTKPDAVLLTIGAIKFDPFTNDPPYNEFYYRANVDEQTAIGRHVEDGTIEWWSRQAPEIVEEALSDENRHSVKEILIKLNKYLVGVDKIWCQGPVFDIAILENLYRQLGLHYNWAFYNIRDSRTLFSLMPRDPRKDISFAAHNALEDCRIQSICVQKSLRNLGVTQ
tara:strand:- start:534 stop:1070 length:537 start_codon:yes stop_codon:yes gene_type:complete